MNPKLDRSVWRSIHRAQSPESWKIDIFTDIEFDKIKKKWDSNQRQLRPVFSEDDLQFLNYKMLEVGKEIPEL